MSTTVLRTLFTITMVIMMVHSLPLSSEPEIKGNVEPTYSSDPEIKGNVEQAYSSEPEIKDNVEQTYSSDPEIKDNVEQAARVKRQWNFWSPYSYKIKTPFFKVKVKNPFMLGGYPYGGYGMSGYYGYQSPFYSHYHMPSYYGGYGWIG